MTTNDIEIDGVKITPDIISYLRRFQEPGNGEADVALIDKVIRLLVGLLDPTCIHADDVSALSDLNSLREAICAFSLIETDDFHCAIYG